MKPKTYHQLTMTEIAKQKKPNAPSKTKIMSDLESSVNDAVEKSMEKLKKKYSDKLLSLNADGEIELIDNRVLDISPIGDSESLEDLKNSPPAALFEKKLEKYDAELEKRWLQEFSSFKKEFAKMINKIQNKIEKEVDEIRQSIRIDMNDWRDGMKEHLSDFNKSSEVTDKRFDVVEKSVAAQHNSLGLIESKMEGNFGVLNVKVDTMEEQILELRKEIQTLKSKPELAPGDGVVNAEVGSHEGGKGQFSDQDAEKLRILLNNYDRDESSY